MMQPESAIAGARIRMVRKSFMHRSCGRIGPISLWFCIPCRIRATDATVQERA